MADQRVLQGRTATLTATWTDSDGSETTPTAPVTVHVALADGSTLLASGTPATIAGTKVEATLTPAQTASLNLLTATWTDAAGVALTSTAEIVGGFFFSVAEARQLEPSISDPGKYTVERIISARQEVEEECEYICDRAFVPRYRRDQLGGTGSTSLLLRDAEIRAVRSVRIASSLTSQAQITVLSADQLAGLVAFNETLTRTDFGLFPDGNGNITIEYEYGWDRPPFELKRAAVRRLRSKLTWSASGIPDKAKTWSSGDGGTYSLDRPDAFKTGIDEVDAAYERYSRRSLGDQGMVPVSRSLDYDPQRWGLFHGARR